ncbi:MAG TPA: tetratricopeptide repeat protein [Thermoanaerobaculia bacterium]|nr:tetratricopeptide repeat protein [Thermoanaerobaculia bacterium]
MDGYSSRDVAAMLGLSMREVRSYAGLLSSGRGEHGEYRFTFQDLVLLRTAKELVASRVPPARVKRALAQLRRQLPSNRPLSAVRFAADGRGVLVRDGETLWNPDSGQVVFDFVGEAEAGHRFGARSERGAIDPLDADEWHALGLELEGEQPEKSREAYAKALELEPEHADAHVNLGRLLHEDGDLAAAETHYRAALRAVPAHSVAAFNLGVALEDQGRLAEAAEAYQSSIRADASAADAHYRLAAVYERLGKKSAAIRHLSAYRRLLTK